MERDVAAYFQKLMGLGPIFRYHPDSSMSLIICPLVNQKTAKTAFDTTILRVKFCSSR